MKSDISKDKKKRTIKDIILRLHKGMSIEEARDLFLKEAGTITSAEITEIEQELINEGLAIDEIKRFCNVHALLFESGLQTSTPIEQLASHPISLFKDENREIEKILGNVKSIGQEMEKNDTPKLRQQLKDSLSKLKGLDIHYTRKEQVLFPYLEKHGFVGPSTVMWGVDNDIRDLLRKSLANLDSLKGKSDIDDFMQKLLRPLIEEVEGMIFKEENILFPATIEKLTAEDWVEVLKASDDVGYAFVEKQKNTEQLMRDLKAAFPDEPGKKGSNSITLPTGEFRLEELTSMLNTLPVDITFVDKDDKVRYFTDNRERIFIRTKSVLGRKVQNCHPPQSLDVVEKILNAFKEGEKDHFDFWIRLEGKLVYIRYFAVRDAHGKYLGTLEITQDITQIQALKGEKRLLSEKD